MYSILFVVLPYLSNTFIIRRNNGNFSLEIRRYWKWSLILIVHFNIKQLYKLFYVFPTCKNFHASNHGSLFWKLPLNLFSFLQSCTKTKCHYNVISCLHIHIHTNNNGQINCICLFSIKKYNCQSWLLQVIIYTSANCLIFCYLVKYTHLVRQRFELQLTSQSAVLFTSENYLMSSIKIEYVSRKLRFALNNHFNRIYIILITKIKETLENELSVLNILNQITVSVVKRIAI